MSNNPLLNVTPIAAFSDNYIWLLECNETKQAVVIDPGDSRAVLEHLQQRQIELTGIWITHHHPDHVGGVELLQKQSPVAVWGPLGSPAQALFGHTLSAGQEVAIGPHRFTVLAIPGHTLDHIAYYSPSSSMLFCGDTLFAGGCGRVFEGTFEQMHSSLQQLAALPQETAVYCAHEYTLANLIFARAADPNNIALKERQRHAVSLRESDIPTLPSTIGLELTTNPFLRCQLETMAQTLAEPLQNAGFDSAQLATGAQRFAALRQWKDNF